MTDNEVRVPPGATAFTLMLGASSKASWRISPIWACLLAVYHTPPPSDKTTLTL